MAKKQSKEIEKSIDENLDSVVKEASIKISLWESVLKKAKLVLNTTKSFIKTKSSNVYIKYQELKPSFVENLEIPSFILLYGTVGRLAISPWIPIQFDIRDLELLAGTGSIWYLVFDFITMVESSTKSVRTVRTK